MVLTPTYHVFDMYKVHQDAELLDLNLSSGTYSAFGREIPEVSASASRDANGRIHISLCNLNHASSSSVSIDLRGLQTSTPAISGSTLTSDALDAHNTFDQPERIAPQPFHAFKLEGSRLELELPSKSVTVIELA